MRSTWSLAEGDATHLLRTPLLPYAANGAGDLMAALFLFHRLARGDTAQALAAATSSVFGVLRRTAAAGAAEMLLIAAQDELVSPEQRFVPCGAEPGAVRSGRWRRAR